MAGGTLHRPSLYTFHSISRVAPRHTTGDQGKRAKCGWCRLLACCATYDAAVWGMLRIVRAATARTRLFRFSSLFAPFLIPCAVYNFINAH